MRGQAIGALMLVSTSCGAPSAPVQVPSFRFDPALVNRFTEQALAPKLPPDPCPCPAETFWDGSACTHLRATCGGWDGESCAPTVTDAHTEALARAEYEAIDADARKICPEDDPTKQVYSGAAADILNAVDTALGQAREIDRRMEHLREANRAPHWMAATFARTGSVYDCIWTSLRNASPASYFTPKQLVALQQMQAIAQQLQQAGWPPGTNSAAHVVQTMTQQVQAAFQSNVGQSVAFAGARTAGDYFLAATLAHRYALEGYAFVRASERLPVIASEVGDLQMARWIVSLRDPTDPEPDPTKRRSVCYAPGAFRLGP